MGKRSVFVLCGELLITGQPLHIQPENRSLRLGLLSRKPPCHRAGILVSSAVDADMPGDTAGLRQRPELLLLSPVHPKWG